MVMLNLRTIGNAGRLRWADGAVLVMLTAFIYGVVSIAREWTGPLRPAAEIHLEPGYLPLYAFGDGHGSDSFR